MRAVFVTSCAVLAAAHQQGREWDNVSAFEKVSVPATGDGSKQELLCLEQEQAGLFANTTTFTGDCCRLYDIGCPARFGCYASSPSTWGSVQQDWCCRAKDVGCAHTCDVPAATMATRQALYCCDRKGVGCTAEWKEEQARADEEREAQQRAAGVSRRDLRLKVMGRRAELVSNPKKVLQRLRWALLAASLLLQEDPTRLVVGAMEAANSTRVPVPRRWNTELFADEYASVTYWVPSAGPAASADPVLPQSGQSQQDELYVYYAVTGASDAAVLQIVRQIDTQVQTGSLGGKAGPKVRTVADAHQITLASPCSSTGHVWVWEWAALSVGALVVAGVVWTYQSYTHDETSHTALRGVGCDHHTGCASAPECM